MGRKAVEIDKKQLESLCSIMCTVTEVASFFDCSRETIQRFCKKEYKATITEVFEIYSKKGLVSLRRSQFRLAETNVTMNIWLSKQYLGQRDYDKIRDIQEELLKDDNFLQAIKNSILLQQKQQESTGAA